MRKAPKQSILYKLFSLSGNLCAFPKCGVHIVSDTDQLVGNVCHIEAANEGGERWNANQTDDERRDMSNLILLCATHHLETNNVYVYTVEVLKRMKQEHEAEQRGKPYRPPEQVIEQAQLQVMIEQYNSMSGPGQQINPHSSIVHVTQINGLQPDAIETHLMGLLANQDSNVTLIIRETVDRRIQPFISVLGKLAQEQLQPNEIEKLRLDPGVLATFLDASKVAARKDNEVLRQELAQLVVNRVKSDEQNLNLTSAYNEAIKVTGNITYNQLKILALSFMAMKVTFGDVPNWQALNRILCKVYLPLLDVKVDAGEYQHLVAQRCGTISIGTHDFVQQHAKEYPHLSVRPTHKNDIAASGLQDHETARLFVEFDEGRMIIAEDLRQRKVFEAAVNAIIGEVDRRAPIMQLYENTSGATDIFRDDLIKNTDIGKQVIEKIESTEILHFDLTSIGTVLAAMHVEAATGISTNPKIWINTL